jgi:hypothetical protein
MTQEAALKLALEALENELSIDWTNNDEFNASAEKMYKAIVVIKKALAQPEQECPNLPNCNGGCFQCEYFNVETREMEYPVAQPEQETVALVIDGVLVKSAIPEKFTGHLYIQPLQRTWVGLTDEEIEVLFQTAADTDEEVHIRFARAIEAKLKELNDHGI